MNSILSDAMSGSVFLKWEAPPIGQVGTLHCNVQFMVSYPLKCHTGTRNIIHPPQHTDGTGKQLMAAVSRAHWNKNRVTEISYSLTLKDGPIDPFFNYDSDNCRWEDWSCHGSTDKRSSQVDSNSPILQQCHDRFSLTNGKFPSHTLLRVGSTWFISKHTAISAW